MKNSTKAIPRMLLIATLASTPTAQADLYRCEHPDGKIIYQDQPCAEGAKSNAIAQANYSAGKSLTVYRDATNTFSGTITINGVTAKGHIDTGATWLTLTPTLAIAMGIKLTGKPNAIVNTANGQVQTEITRAPIVKLGDMEAYDVEVSINPNSPTLIGMSMLKNFKISDENGNLLIAKR